MMSIREVAATGIINEHALRMLVKSNAVPGVIFVGKKALINHDLLAKWLDDPTIKRVSTRKEEQ